MVQSFRIKLKRPQRSTGISHLKSMRYRYRLTTHDVLTDLQQRYNHIANENKAQNMATYRKWVESHTPAEIERNNLARHALSRRGVESRKRPIKDDRRVTRPRPPVAFFLKDRFDSGDFKGMIVKEAVGLVGREWKGLTDSEKKVSSWSSFRLTAFPFH